MKAPWKDGNMTKYPVADTTPKRGLRIDLRKNEVVLMVFAVAAPILGAIVSLPL